MQLLIAQISRRYEYIDKKERERHGILDVL